jgi:hypothetical protein
MPRPIVEISTPREETSKSDKARKPRMKNGDFK